jgi:PmbA protein
LGAFLGAFSAKAALEGTADYRGKVGQSIAAASLILRDRPSYKQGFGFTTFDDEGVARRDLTLIDKGMLQGWFHNGAPARHYKISHTAHGAQGARGSLGTSSTQIMIDTGSASKHDFLSGQVFKIIGLKGLHSWTNAISGHFSLAAEGMVYDNGVILGRASKIKTKRARLLCERSREGKGKRHLKLIQKPDEIVY